MKLKSISGLTYYVTDMDKTAKFYEALGFKFGKYGEHATTVYLNWFSVEFRPQAKPVESSNTGVLANINVEDVDEFYKGVKAKGLKPASEPTDTSQGRREFLLHDPDGYNLVFFQKK